MNRNTLDTNVQYNSGDRMNGVELQPERNILNIQQSKNEKAHKSKIHLMYIHMHGDTTTNTQRMVVDYEQYKTLGELLSDMSNIQPKNPDQLEDTFNGFQRLHTPRGQHRIFSISELRDGHVYVCSKSEPFKGLHYPQYAQGRRFGSYGPRPVHKATTGFRRILPPIQQRFGHFDVKLDNPTCKPSAPCEITGSVPPLTTEKDAEKRKQLLSVDLTPSSKNHSPTANNPVIMISGELRLVPRGGRHPHCKMVWVARPNQFGCGVATLKVILSRAAVQTVGQVICEISNAFGTRWTNDPIRHLYCLTGREVRSVNELFNKQHRIFLATGVQRLFGKQIQTDGLDVSERASLAETELAPITGNDIRALLSKLWPKHPDPSSVVYWWEQRISRVCAAAQKRTSEEHHKPPILVRFPRIQPKPVDRVFIRDGTFIKSHGVRLPDIQGITAKPSGPDGFQDSGFEEQVTVEHEEAMTARIDNKAEVVGKLTVSQRVSDGSTEKSNLTEFVECGLEKVPTITEISSTVPRSKGNDGIQQTIQSDPSRQNVGNDGNSNKKEAKKNNVNIKRPLEAKQSRDNGQSSSIDYPNGNPKLSISNNPEHNNKQGKLNTHVASMIHASIPRNSLPNLQFPSTINMLNVSLQVAQKWRQLKNKQYLVTGASSQTTTILSKTPHRNSTTPAAQNGTEGKMKKMLIGDKQHVISNKTPIDGKTNQKEIKQFERNHESTTSTISKKESNEADTAKNMPITNKVDNIEKDKDRKEKLSDEAKVKDTVSQDEELKSTPQTAECNSTTATQQPKSKQQQKQKSGTPSRCTSAAELVKVDKVVDESHKVEPDKQSEKLPTPKKSTLKNLQLRYISDPEYLSKRYHIGRILGDGNFAIVRLARRRDTGQQYAMKMIDKAKLKGKESMLHREITILHQCNHPNIVRLIEEFETPNEIWLAMEFVKDGDLFDGITKSVKYTESVAAGIVTDLASALFYLHCRSVVHRDVKPENILLWHQLDGKIRIKLADFGLALEVKRQLTTICGTPTYIAPEILQERGYSIEVDMWALGIITYIMLCGFAPFRDPERRQSRLFESIKRGVYVFLSPYWDGVSKNAKDLISRLIVVNPQKRLTALETLVHPWVFAEGSVQVIDNSITNPSFEDRRLRYRRELERQARGVAARNLTSDTQQPDLQCQPLGLHKDSLPPLRKTAPDHQGRLVINQKGSTGLRLPNIHQRAV